MTRTLKVSVLIWEKINRLFLIGINKHELKPKLMLRLLHFQGVNLLKNIKTA